MHRIRMAVAVAATGLLSACVTTPPTKFVVSVDSYARADAKAKAKYVLLPGNAGVEADDLQFQEFSKTLDTALASRGFVKVSDLSAAEVAILFSYRIGDPKSDQVSVDVPIFGQTGVIGATTVGNVSRSGAYSSSTTYTPAFGITGYTSSMTSYTTYTRTSMIGAYDATAYSQGKPVQVWRTSMVSTGSSGDLRRVMPFLVQAATPYLATDTGRAIRVEIEETLPPPTQ